MNLGDEGESPWGDVPSNSKAKGGASGNEKKSDDTTDAPTSPPSTTASTAAPVKAPGEKSSRNPRRAPAQPTRLEAVDDSLGPLGPLGDTSQSAEPQDDEPPELPKKETSQQPSRASKPPVASPPRSRGRARHDPAFDDDEDSLARPGPRFPPPVEPPGDGSNRPAQPSMSIEQAAKPSFSISVGDPHKVGDLTSSHTMYQVRTRTTSKAYRHPEFEVSRRYRDFLWLYNQLHGSNPGVVVPPPPEKQAVGRFDTNFVESRRAALERMLNKTAAHPILQHDGDLKLFLESETFTLDLKHRERKDPDMPEPKSGGMFSGFNLSVGSATKFIEHDDWFLDRRVYLDSLESQLKALLRTTEICVSQRKGLADASFDLSTALNTLSQVELSPSLSGALASLSDLQLRIRDLYDRQAQQDVLTLGNVLDEYIRLIGSIKKAFDQRQRSWHNWHNAESDLQKRKSALDKLMRQGRSQQDKMSQLQADVADAERRAHQSRLSFEDLGRGMRGELERFEREKVEDFRMGVETFLESAVEAQKELIELWETYLMQLDADEEEGESTSQQPPQKPEHPPNQQKPPPRGKDVDTPGGGPPTGEERSEARPPTADSTASSTLVGSARPSGETQPGVRTSEDRVSAEDEE